MTRQAKRPVVMDCDPGTDDALALLMMFAAPHLEMRAVTTVAGNQNIEKNTSNALRIAEAFGFDTVVAQGSYPLMKRFEAAPAWINGASGLGRAVLPPASQWATPESAVEILCREAKACGGALELLATGPLTNLALLFRIHPEAAPLIRRITLMGGACRGGNATPCAEFNIYTDPEAAKIVFAAGVPLTMIGLDVCNRTPLAPGELAELYALHTKASDFVCNLMSYPPREGETLPREGIVMFDALAAAAVIDPDIVSGPDAFVDVETRGEFTAGRTLVDLDHLWKKRPNTRVALHSDREAFFRLVKRTVEFYR